MIGGPWKAGDDPLLSDHGLFQVMPPSIPLRLFGVECGPEGQPMSRRDVDVTVTLLEQSFECPDSPRLAVDGGLAVGEVRVLGQVIAVSSELLGDMVGMTRLIADMVAGKPIVPPRQAVERRKDRAALARLRHARLMLATFRRPDPALSRMVRFHRPVTHQFGRPESTPWCLMCGSEQDYPCDLMHSVAEAIEFDID